MSIIKSGTTSTTAYQVEGNINGDLVFQTNGTTTAMTINTSQNVGIGTSSPEAYSGYKTLEVQGSTGGVFQSSNTAGTQKALFTTNSVGATLGTITNSPLLFQTNNSEKARIDASGNLGIGTTSPGTRIDVTGGVGRFTSTASNFAELSLQARYSSSFSNVGLGQGADGTGYLINQHNAAMVFGTNNTERARISAGGDYFVAKTGQSIGTVGHELRANGITAHTADSQNILYINRLTNDGDLVQFFQATAQEGSISVSGNTVSYNAFAGSHWSQLQDGSKPDILRGTVMESINELCVWPDEQNERLPKSKISDTAGSKKVYGVFMAWDNDWTETNDMYVTAVGAFICRVNGSVTVEEGDLLESNGDGTARVQADDIIRSSTIGKVTSTVKTHEYDDGSYCVPTVLYCG